MLGDQTYRTTYLALGDEVSIILPTKTPFLSLWTQSPASSILQTNISGNISALVVSYHNYNRQKQRNRDNI